MGSSIVLGLDFGGTKTAVAVAAGNGTIRGRSIVPAVRDARDNLAAAVAAARTLLARVAGNRGPDAVGVSTFGIPGPEGVALAPAIEGWSDLAIAREVGHAFGGVPVRVATDVKVAARMEAERGALAGCDPALYLNLGTGLAVAIVAGGTVLSGRHAASGEIGYNLRRVRDVGLEPYDRVMLEEAVSGGALVASARRAAPEVDGAAAVF